MAPRQRYQRVLLPGEREGRREFLRKGIVGGLILVVGGGVWLATRRTRAIAGVGPLSVLSPEEATVVLAIANRLVPERPGFPRPLEVGVPRKVDAAVAGLHPATQKEIRRLLNLFEGAVAGFLFEGQVRAFSACSPWEQDERLRAWSTSRIALRRSGFQALKKLVCSAYYGSPETYAAVGYPGPPRLPPPVPPERPEAEAGGERAPPGLRPRPADAAARPVEPPGPARPVESASRPAQGAPASRLVDAVPEPSVPVPRPVQAEPARPSGAVPPEETTRP